MGIKKTANTPGTWLLIRPQHRANGLHQRVLGKGFGQQRANTGRGRLAPGVVGQVCGYQHHRRGFTALVQLPLCQLLRHVNAVQVGQVVIAEDNVVVFIANASQGFCGFGGCQVAGLIVSGQRQAQVTWSSRA